MKKLIKNINIMAILVTLTLTIIPVMVNAETTNVAKIGDNTYTSLCEAITNAKEGDIVEMLTDSAESQSINVTKAITIEGNSHKIDFSSISSNTAFSISTSSQVTIKNINLEGAKRGITFNSSENNLALENSTLTVSQRGLTALSDANKNSTLNVVNCTIQKAGNSNYDQYVDNADLRGISLWEYKDSTISIKDTTIQGFTYDINVSGTNVDFSNTKLIVDNCTLKGRAGINCWASNLNIELKNSNILGINNFSGEYESFANIVFENGYNTINIQNTKFTNYQDEIGLANRNALQYMVGIRGENNNITITGNTTFVDTTNKLNSIIEPNGTENNIIITGGTYQYDVKDYLAEGYTTIKNGNLYVVGLKVKSVQMEENIEIEVGSSYSLNVEMTPTNTVETATYSSENENIATISNSGKIEAKKVGTTNVKVKAGDIEKICKVVVKEKEIKYEIPSIGNNTNINVGITEKENINEILNSSLKENQELYSKVKEHLDNGKQITTEIEIESIDTINVPSESVENIQKIVGENGKIANYYDISILLKADGEEIGEINTLTEKVKFSIKVPAELLQEGRQFYIIKLHDGKVEKLEATLNGETLTFETNEFSLYALAYEDYNKEITEDTNEKADSSSKEIQNDVPQTGDTAIIVFTSLAIISTLGLAIVNKNNKKSKH